MNYSMCSAVEYGIPCDKPVSNRTQMLCDKHMGRFRRHGTYLLPTDTKLSRRKRAKFGGINPHALCMCAHPRGAHDSADAGGKNCKHPGCDCKAFMITNDLKLKRVFKQIESLGFNQHINDEAYCAKCDSNISIGRWYDEGVIRRATIHARQDCAPMAAKKLARSNPVEYTRLRRI